jgi:pimeloyl-ACP methyl ester carboxylesterase
MTETIVLVHGLWMNGFEMSLMGRRLHRDYGYEARRFHYASMKRGLGDNVERLHQFVQALPADKVHFVGHSLGGVLILHTLHRFPNPKIGRVVCLGSPLVDSAPARLLSRAGPGRFIIGRTLRDSVLAAPLRMVECAQAVGVIAGTMAVGIGSALGVLVAPHDGVVSVHETQLPGITDHVEILVNHFGLVLTPSVVKQVVHFIQNGRFQHHP